MQFQLVLRLSQRVYSFPINRVMVIGRSHTSDLVLDDRRLSRVHCRLCAEGDQLWIEDMGSANGTQVDGEAVFDRRPLSPGDRIELGPYSFVVERGRGVAAPSTDLPPKLSYSALALTPTSERRAIRFAQVAAARSVRCRTFADALQAGDIALLLLCRIQESPGDPAPLIATLHQALRDSGARGEGPAQALARLSAELSDAGREASALCIAFDSQRCRVSYASGDHSLPLLLDQATGSGRFRRMQGVIGLPLGRLAHAEFEQRHVQLDGGEVIAAATDDLDDAFVYGRDCPARDAVGAAAWLRSQLDPGRASEHCCVFVDLAGEPVRST